MRFSALLGRWTDNRMLRQTLRLLSGCCLAYGGAMAFGLPDGFWALITAVVVTQPALDATLTAGRDRILGTTIGALAGFVLIEGARFGIAVQPMFWAAMVPLAMLTAAWPNLRLSCVTLIVVVLVPSGGLSLARPFDRVLEILHGTVSAVVVAAVL